ncbi:integrase core domain-containing protein [Actinomadura geliboluensis]|nr:integrase core domain-containing protein [Actinomadura geliboluensis]
MAVNHDPDHHPEAPAQATTPRNRIWELDHQQLPVLVLLPRGRTARPWLTTIVDEATRALLGWTIAPAPHTPATLTAIRMALIQDPARGPFGAVPAGIRIDPGLELAAHMVGEAFTALRVTELRPSAHQPHHKRRPEQLYTAIDTTLLCGLPGYTTTPRDTPGGLDGGLDGTPDDGSTAPATGTGRAETRPMQIERLAAAFADWTDWYNLQRPHAGLGGRTPAQA